MKVATFITPI